MRIARSTLIGTAVAWALFGQNSYAEAPEGPSPTTTDQGSANMEEVVVTGIRRSIEESLEAKRQAATVAEVVSAEDIGKLPDKNVADALQRVPGVNISSAAAGEGGFDENDRVSIRGTSPSLTQTTINGHAVATGDWFIQDQYQTVGRSVSYAMLPSEIVRKVVVNKSQTADLIEGGVAGSVDIQTRKPLDFERSFSGDIQVQGERSDLAAKTDPQVSGLVNWKSEANNFGVVLQGFSEKRDVRRDGQEFLGYNAISPTSPAAVVHPELANVAVPTFIGAALFTQQRKRNGGDFDIELAPSDNLTFDLNGFYSHLAADNYNRNFLAATGNLAQGYVPTSYTVKNGTLVAATYANQGKTPAAIIDDIYRPGAASETYYVDFDTKFVPTERLTITSQLGYTHGVGKTPNQPAYEGQMYSGLVYNMNGISSPASISFPDVNPGSFNGVSTSWSWNDIATTIDTEKYAQIDALFDISNGPFQSVKFGVRYADHVRSVDFPEDGGCLSSCWSSVPTWDGAVYPGNFGSGLNPPAGFLTGVWQLNPAAIAAYVANNVSTGISRHYWQGEMRVQEKDSAGYAMANFGGAGWAANVGVRVVSTREASLVNVSGGSNPITTSAFGPYTPTLFTNQYHDFLPSANIKFDLDKDLVLRGAVAKTMARPDYSALGGAVNLTDLTLTGTGGNPNLRPIRSTNYDASLEWYFAPQSLLSLGVFYMDLTSYVDFGTTNGTYFDMLKSTYETYSITSPFNVRGKDRGFEVGYQQPIWRGFGFTGNYTYAKGAASDGSPLVGASKNTYNLGGYYEDKYVSARIAYTYRSDFLVGLDRSYAENEAAIGSLDASLNFTITEHFKLNLDGLNLTNAILRYYANNTDQPRAFYTNGRQYYFGATYKF